MSIYKQCVDHGKEWALGCNKCALLVMGLPKCTTKESKPEPKFQINQIVRYKWDSTSGPTWVTDVYFNGFGNLYKTNDCIAYLAEDQLFASDLTKEGDVE